jgi:hypothetical protein
VSGQRARCACFFRRRRLAGVLGDVLPTHRMRAFFVHPATRSRLARVWCRYDDVVCGFSQGWFNYTMDVKIALVLTDALLDSYEESVAP